MLDPVQIHLDRIAEHAGGCNLEPSKAEGQGRDREDNVVVRIPQIDDKGGGVHVPLVPLVQDQPQRPHHQRRFVEAERLGDVVVSKVEHLAVDARDPALRHDDPRVKQHVEEVEEGAQHALDQRDVVVRSE